MADITTTGDVTLMVKTFYANLLLNNEVKPMFEHVNFEQHLPHMVAFWEFVLLDKPGYTANVFDKHVNLALNTNHFKIWLTVFETTVNNLFEGLNANKAIFRAQTIAFSFESKLKQMGKLK